jgi:hypothetical protein
MALASTVSLTTIENEFTANSFTLDDQLAPEVLRLSNGGFVVAYTNNEIDQGVIMLNFYDAFSQRVGSYQIAAQDTTLAAGRPSLTQLSNDNVLVVWDEESSNGTGLAGRLFTPSGNALGAELVLSSGPYFDDPQVAALPGTQLFGGGFVVTHQQENANTVDIFVSRYDNSGGFDGGNAVAISDGIQADSAVAALVDGGYVVTFTDTEPADQEIRGRIYNADGTQRTDTFVIGHIGDNTESRVVGLPNGNWAVVYTDSGWAEGGTLGNGITLQIFSPAGDNLTPFDAIRVNAASAVEEHQPDITVLENGYIVVTWTRPRDGGFLDIYARVFTSDGGAVTGEFAITDTGFDSDSLSSVSGLSFGQFLTAWQDGANGDPIFGEGSDSDGSRITAEVNEITRTTTGDGADDTFIGDALREFVDGGGGNDTIHSGGGNDALIGGGGNDLIDGSGGNDLAMFAGNRANYLVTLLANGDVQISDQRPGAPYGTDTLRGVERIGFADGVFNTFDLTSGNVAALGDVLWQRSDGMVATADHDVGMAAVLQFSGIGDFDADGDSDILWRLDNGLVVTWEMEGGTHDSSHSLGIVSGSWQIRGTGDFDGDGDSDILWRHNDGLVVSWEMENGTYVVNHNLGSVPTTWQIAATGDFDGDGDAELLWRHTEGAVVTWEMEDGELVVNHNLGTVPTSWHIAGTGDFDADGDSEILWPHDGGAVVTWEMDGGAFVVNHNLADVPTNWQNHGTEDFDSDGDSDILWRHEEGTVVTWNMEDGNLLQTQNFGVVSTVWQIRGTGEFDLV